MNQTDAVPCGNYLFVDHERGLVLLEWRKKDAKTEVAHWCVPGGKYDEAQDATLFDTASRECCEETGCTPRTMVDLGPTIETPDGWELNPWAVTRWRGTIPPDTDAGRMLQWWTPEQVADTSKGFEDHVVRIVRRAAERVWG